MKINAGLSAENADSVELLRLEAVEIYTYKTVKSVLLIQYDVKVVLVSVWSLCLKIKYVNRTHSGRLNSSIRLP